MALTASTNAGLDASGSVAVAGSGYAGWFIAHDNCNGNSDGGTNPLAITQAGARWVNIPPGATRLYLRLIFTDAATVSTAPIVRVWGADKRVEDGTKPPDGAQVERLAVDITLTGSKIGDLTLAGTAYDFGATTADIDLLGNRAVLVEVTTAQSGAEASKAQGKFLN